MKMINIVLMFTVLASCSQDNMLKFNGQNYTISYPVGWEQSEQLEAIYFFSPKENESDMFQENVNLMLQNLSKQPMDLKQYTELTKKQVIENFGSTAIISLKSTTLSGQNAKELTYNMNYKGRNLKIKQYWFIFRNTAYLFTYTAESSSFDKYENTATEIIRSFKLTS